MYHFPLGANKLLVSEYEHDLTGSLIVFVTNINFFPSPLRQLVKKKHKQKYSNGNLFRSRHWLFLHVELHWIFKWDSHYLTVFLQNNQKRSDSATKHCLFANLSIRCTYQPKPHDSGLRETTTLVSALTCSLQNKTRRRVHFVRPRSRVQSDLFYEITPLRRKRTFITKRKRKNTRRPRVILMPWRRLARGVEFKHVRM